MNKKTIIERFFLLDTSCISDALDSFRISGGLQNIYSRVGKKIVGPAFTVKYRKISKKEKKEFQNAGNYIDQVPAGSIIVIDNQGRSDCTSWGNILTEVAIKKKILGTVIYGSVRDIDKIKKLGYPVYSTGVFMQSGKNRAIKIRHQIKIKIGKTEINPNDLIFCDDNGCLVIPNKILKKVLERAENIKENENKIIEDIKKGIPLEIARKKHNYSRPWIK